MLTTREQLEWLVAKEMAQSCTSDKSQANMICKMMDVFISHDISLSATADICQELDAISKEYKARQSGDVVSLTDILKIRNNKGKKDE